MYVVCVPYRSTAHTVFRLRGVNMPKKWGGRLHQLHLTKFIFVQFYMYKDQNALMFLHPLCFFYGAPDIGGQAGKAGMAVLPGGRISGQKAQKGPQKNGWPE